MLKLGNLLLSWIGHDLSPSTKTLQKTANVKNILQVDLAGKRREFLLLASLGSRVISDSCQKQLWVPFCGAYEDYKAYASAVHEIKMAR